MLLTHTHQYTIYKNKDTAPFLKVLSNLQLYKQLFYRHTDHFKTTSD